MAPGRALGRHSPGPKPGPIALGRAGPERPDPALYRFSQPDQSVAAHGLRGAAPGRNAARTCPGAQPVVRHRRRPWTRPISRRPRPRGLGSLWSRSFRRCLAARPGRRYWAVALLLLVVLWAWLLGLGESQNLWDYLIDPWLVLYAVPWAIASALGRRPLSP